MAIEDITVSIGIQGALDSASARIAEAKEAVLSEFDGIPSEGLEVAIKKIAEAQKMLAQALTNAANDINK